MFVVMVCFFYEMIFKRFLLVKCFDNYNDYVVNWFVLFEIIFEI